MYWSLTRPTARLVHDHKWRLLNEVHVWVSRWLIGAVSMTRTLEAKGKPAKVRLLTKRERNYILERLHSTDINIFASFATKHVEKEAVQFLFYDRWRLWCAFLLLGFCSLLERHTKGGKQFARFLVSWHNFVGASLVCQEHHLPFLHSWHIATSIHPRSEHYFT